MRAEIFLFTSAVYNNARRDYGKSESGSEKPSAAAAALVFVLLALLLLPFLFSQMLFSLSADPVFLLIFSRTTAAGGATHVVCVAR